METNKLLPVILDKSNPSRRNLVRDTSITFTCNNTCCTPLSVIRLMTLRVKYSSAISTMIGTCSAWST